MKHPLFCLPSIPWMCCVPGGAGRSFVVLQHHPGEARSHFPSSFRKYGFGVQSHWRYSGRWDVINIPLGREGWDLPTSSSNHPFNGGNKQEQVIPCGFILAGGWWMDGSLVLSLWDADKRNQLLSFLHPRAKANVCPSSCPSVIPKQCQMSASSSKTHGIQQIPTKINNDGFLLIWKNCAWCFHWSWNEEIPSFCEIFIKNDNNRVYF